MSRSHTHTESHRTECLRELIAGKGIKDRTAAKRKASYGRPNVRSSSCTYLLSYQHAARWKTTVCDARLAGQTIDRSLPSSAWPWLTRSATLTDTLFDSRSHTR